MSKGNKNLPFGWKNYFFKILLLKYTAYIKPNDKRSCIYKTKRRQKQKSRARNKEIESGVLMILFVTNLQGPTPTYISFATQNINNPIPNRSYY